MLKNQMLQQFDHNGTNPSHLYVDWFLSPLLLGPCFRSMLVDYKYNSDLSMSKQHVTRVDCGVIPFAPFRLFTKKSEVFRRLNPCARCQATSSLGPVAQANCTRSTGRGNARIPPERKYFDGLLETGVITLAVRVCSFSMSRSTFLIVNYWYSRGTPFPWLMLTTWQIGESQEMVKYCHIIHVFHFFKGFFFFFFLVDEPN